MDNVQENLSAVIKALANHQQEMTEKVQTLIESVFCPTKEIDEINDSYKFIVGGISWCGESNAIVPALVEYKTTESELVSDMLLLVISGDNDNRTTFLDCSSNERFSHNFQKRELKKEDQGDEFDNVSG